MQERKQLQTQVIRFEIQVQSSTSPPSPREGFHYPLKIFSQRSIHKETTRFTQGRSTQLQLLNLYTKGSIKPMRFTSSWWPRRSQTISFTTSCSIWCELKLKKFVKEKNELKWINLRTENLQKLILKSEHLKQEN